MTFESWLAANGYDADKLTASQKKHLTASWQAETSPPPVAAPVAVQPTPEQKIQTPWEAELEAANREAERRRSIDELAGEQVRANIRHPERIKHFELLRNAAIESGWDFPKFQLELLKAKHNVGPIISVTRGREEITTEIVEAAALRGVSYPHLEKRFSEQTLSAVDKRFKRGLGLKELLVVAAEQNNGYRGSSRDLRALCQAAFRDSSGDPQFMSDVGPSTINVSGILSNVANKFLEAGFLYTEQAWRGCSKIVQANDYKEMSFYRLGGSNKFEKVPPGGEIKHGTLSELSYGLRVDPYGKVLGISEQDMRNDDLGAFASVADEIGRGGGDSLNDVFWNDHFLADHNTFFPTDNSLGNYVAASTAPLSLAGLDLVETAFRLQTKPDGTPLGAMPGVLVVPAKLYNTALQLMGSMGLVVGTTPATGPDRNVFFGRYRVVSSVFLDADSSIIWYMLADPMNIPMICVGFLDGVQVPTVETGSFDFDRLGMAMRGVLRFGVRKHEYRAAVKSKGTS